MPIYKKVNKDFFKIWTPNMAYIPGFFAADGYMTKNKKGAHFWNIQITDKELLEQIKTIIGSEHKISVRVGTEREKILYRLQIGSKEMFSDLLSLGFRQGKTKSLVVPEVPAKYFRDFVRGYFDGDGCVWMGYVHRNRPKKSLALMTVFTSCSSDFLAEICRRLRLFSIFKGTLRKGKGNFYRLNYSIISSLKLYDFMYNHPILDSSDIFLDRKKVTFEKFIKMRP
ncbi:MAG: hypothetical protein NT077_02735 [Candidatus Taylorbacteria bacterium]|nr:hypothetical protein [Candidatus Taylorbacteria bacterium]